MVKIITELSEIPKNKKVVVDAFADWCGPCRKIAPMYEELSKKYTEIYFFKFDVDQSEELSTHFEIKAMPTFVFLNNGKKIGKVEGANLEKITALLDKLDKLGKTEKL